MQNQCQQCGDQVPDHNGRGRPRKYCGAACRRKAYRAIAKTRPGRPCTREGCDRKVVARDLCITHYNQQNPSRHVKRAQPCAWCGTEVFKLPRSSAVHGVVCSPACRGHLFSLTHRGEQKSSSTELVAIERAPKHDTRPRPARSARLRWFAGSCAVCAAPFVAPLPGRTCSPACGDKYARSVHSDHKHRRRVRLRDAHVSAVNRYAIFRRDDWTCWICHKQVDRNADPQSDDAPSLDHIIPIANGGTHEPANVRTAHRGCNAQRSNTPTLTRRTGERVAVLF